MAVQNLMEATLNEIERVSGIIEIYKKFPGGALSAALMKLEIDEAKRCVNEGDTIGLINAYEKLTHWEH